MTLGFRAGLMGFLFVTFTAALPAVQAQETRPLELLTWSQNYAPLGGLWVSSLLAALPVVVLLGLLAFFQVRAHVAALAGLAAAFLIALLVYHMPLRLTTAAAVYGSAFGLFPIGWILLNALFIYEISLASKQFDVLKLQVAALAGDRRLQTLLIAFSFGAFIEGCAGFGAPVAITGALLIGLGFKPLDAAKLVLIGNTAPVAFGSLGIPIISLSKVTGLDLHLLSSMVGRQLPPFSFLVPFWLVAVQAGWRGMLGVWPACLVTGGAFALTQFLVSNYHGPWLVDLASSLVSMLALTVLVRFWKPKPVDGEPQAERNAADYHNHFSASGLPTRATLRAWLPWICLTVFVFVWGLPVVGQTLDGWSALKFSVPWLHNAVLRVPPVVTNPEPATAEFAFNWLSATGSALLLAGITAGLFLGLRPLEIVRLYGRTLGRVWLSLVTIAVMLALGFTTRYCGSDATLGLAFTTTAWWFPFFSPLLGWLGVALTGSDTSSNVLFGNMQKVTALQLGVSPVLTAAANSSGGVMGKMIAAQSIVVASVATGGDGPGPAPGAILRAVFWHSLALAGLVGAWVMVQAYWLPWMLPKVP